MERHEQFVSVNSAIRVFNKLKYVFSNYDRSLIIIRRCELIWTRPVCIMNVST